MMARAAHNADAKADDTAHSLPGDLLVPIIIDAVCITPPVAINDNVDVHDGVALAKLPLQAATDAVAALQEVQSLLPTVTQLETASQPVVELITATAVLPSKPGSPLKVERTFRATFVLAVALISFLLGSLLRSLLSPGDYVLLPHAASSADKAVLDVIDPQRKWRHAMKILQVPIPGIGRDLVAAFVDRT